MPARERPYLMRASFRDDVPMDFNSYPLLVDKLKGDGVYLMDEPEAALSPGRQLAALRAIHQLVIASSQFVIATHSPILLSYPNAKIICFSESGVNEISYEHTEHYAVPRDFLNNYPR